MKKFLNLQINAGKPCPNETISYGNVYQCLIYKALARKNPALVAKIVDRMLKSMIKDGNIPMKALEISEVRGGKFTGNIVPLAWFSREDIADILKEQT